MVTAAFTEYFSTFTLHCFSRPSSRIPPNVHPAFQMELREVKLAVQGHTACPKQRPDPERCGLIPKTQNHGVSGSPPSCHLLLWDFLSETIAFDARSLAGHFLSDTG